MEPSTTPESVPAGDKAPATLAQNTGEWGEILHDGLDGQPIEVRNPVHVPRRLSTMERQRQAIALKLAGASYPQIADKLDYHSPNAARVAVTKGLENSLQESAKDLRKIHYGRLEHMLMLVWPRVNTGDQSSIQTALTIMDRMERLYGLAAPQKIDVSHGVREAIIVADGDRDSYLKALQEAATAIDEVVDAEVVSDSEEGAG